MANNPQPLTEAQRAYLAGLFDGEGHVSLLKIRNPADYRGFHYEVKCSIGMTDGFLVQLAEETGIGRVYKRRQMRENWKACYIWTIGANGARYLLPLLLPYMRVKAKQTRAIIEYLESVNAMRKQGNRKGRHHLDFHLDSAARLYDTLRQLNRKGEHRGVPAC